VQNSGNLQYLDPFQVGVPKPYLWLQVTAPNGLSGPIPGLVDTGADISQLPEGYASLMGYAAADLEPVVINTAANTVTLRRAITPCSVTVLGIPGINVPMKPVFAPGVALWGRSDFMSIFSVFLEEKHQRFTLFWD
jgi:hypothetical protein